jgi:ATP-dependent Zn protease
MEILESHRQQLNDTAALLLEKETLTADELPAIDTEPERSSSSG